MNRTPVVGRKEFGSVIGYADSGRVAWIFAISFVYRSRYGTQNLVYLNFRVMTESFCPVVSLVSIGAI